MNKKLFGFFVFSVVLTGSLTHFASASTTAVLMPTSDGNYLQFATSTPSSNHYTLVDETLCNGLTDYNFTSTVGNRDSYGVSLSSLGNGALISKIAIVPCASRNTTGTGSSTLDLFYRLNSSDSSTTGSYALAANTTPAQLATSTYSSLSLFKTSTSILEIGAKYTSGNKGVRLSRIATVLTYTVTVPTAPSALAATNISSSENDLTWTDNSNNELGFKIYRAQNGGSYSQVATTASWNTTSYSDTGLTADQTYSYEVIAYNSAGTSTSNISTAITYSGPPNAPSNLTAVTSSNNVVLTWSDYSTNEDGFKIERSTDNITYTQIATTVPNFSSTTSYTDVAQGGTPHYYRVRAYNTKGNSAYATAVEGIYTVIPSNIYTDTTWTPGNIYRITGGLSVTGAKLTVQAGTIVKLDGNYGSLSVTGTGVLSVQGTSAGSVYFTSYKDDSVGGDTNGDTTSTAPSKGDWNMIQINDGASSTINYAVVRYGGQTNVSPALGADIYVNGGNLNLSNSEVATGWYYIVYESAGTSTISGCDLHNRSGNIGLELVQGAMSVSNSTIHGNGKGIEAAGSGSLALTGNTFSNESTGYPVNVDLGSGLTFAHSGNTSAGSENHAINTSAVLSTAETLSGGDLPYYIVTISVLSGGTLTVGQGAILKFAGGAALSVTGTGVLSVQGSSASSVYFTSIKDDAPVVGGDTQNNGSSGSNAPAHGDWDAITLGSSQASSTIAHAVMRYGGSGGFGAGATVYNNGGILTLDTVEVTTSTTYGINQASGTSTVLSSNIHDDSSDGVYVAGGTVNVSSSNIHNQGVGIYVTGGTANVSSSQVHDQNRGFYMDAGALTAKSSDIFNNSYGFRYAGGTVTFEENAISGNTIYGVDNLTTSPIDATFNYWGSTWGPQSPTGGGSGDLVSTYVTYDPWHHVNNPGTNSSVHGGYLRWAGSTTYTTLWANARTTWNDEKTNEGGGPTVADATSTVDLTIVDDPTIGNDDALYKPKSVPPTTTTDEILVYVNKIQQLGYSNDQIQHALTHELGHGLSLGHSANDDANNIMATTTNSRIDLGNEDKSDYHFIWDSLGWETMQLP